MAALAISDTPDGRRTLALSGRLDATTLPALWDAARRAAADVPRAPIVIDASKVEYCDGAGVALFVDLLRQPREGKVEVTNLAPTYAALLKQFDPRSSPTTSIPSQAATGVEELGYAAFVVWRDVRTQLEFIGETVAAVGYAIRHPRTVRWKDVFRICEQVGADALPDRRVDLVPARNDSRVPVGRADEALRRRDLRRGPDRPFDAARARPADDGDPARRALGRRVRGGDRHDARQPGSRRADDDGLEPGSFPRHAAHPRRAVHDAAARAVLRSRSEWSAARSRCNRSRFPSSRS
jgi:anti-anti-sigma factor